MPRSCDLIMTKVMDFSVIRVIKFIIRVVYKFLRGIYRLLPIPASVRNRIRGFIGRASIRLQKSLGYENPEVLQRYADYENALHECHIKLDEKTAVVNEYITHANAIYRGESILKVINRGKRINQTKPPRIAVQVHIYYTELIGEILNNLDKIPFDFDCFITTDTDSKASLICKEFGKHAILGISDLIIDVVENRGRDIAPFLTQMQSVIDNYDYFCHIHTKKSISGDYGDDWRRYLYKHLLGSEDNISGIIDMFETDQNLGIVFPEAFPVLALHMEWERNYEGCSELLNKLGISPDLLEKLVFPGGNMFWARTSAVLDIFKLGFSQKDFPSEKKQLDDTPAHYIERVWVYVAKNNGFSYLKTFNNCMPISESNPKKRVTIFVHYQPDNTISSHDIKTIKCLSKLSTEFVFVSNSMLSPEETRKIESYVSKIIIRENKGYDFGAWRDALFQYGFNNPEEYDQLVLVNNSVFGPLYDLIDVFAEMERKSLDFWGITVHPEMHGDLYLEKDIVPEHIQSYFMVFEKQVFCSDVFKEFWASVEDAVQQKNVIAKYETEFTQILARHGFKYDVFLQETYYMPKYLLDFATPYTNPYALAVLGSPFVKKKSKGYASNDEKLRLSWFVSQLQLSQ